jgi:homogentisate 1,2-dioxygenase
MQLELQPLDYGNASTPEEFLQVLLEIAKGGTPLDLSHDCYTSPGVHMRKLYIPKGTIAVGRVHKYETMNVMFEGDLDVITTTGKVKASPGDVFVTPAGTQRVVVALQDSIWGTIVGTDIKGDEAVKEAFTCLTYSDFLEFQKLEA